jgi:hypothetical protein
MPEHRLDPENLLLFPVRAEEEKHSRVSYLQEEAPSDQSLPRTAIHAIFKQEPTNSSLNASKRHPSPTPTDSPKLDEIFVVKDFAPP